MEQLDKWLVYVNIITRSGVLVSLHHIGLCSAYHLSFVQRSDTGELRQTPPNQYNAVRRLPWSCLWILPKVFIVVQDTEPFNSLPLIGAVLPTNSLLQVWHGFQKMPYGIKLVYPFFVLILSKNFSYSSLRTTVWGAGWLLTFRVFACSAYQ